MATLRMEGSDQVFTVDGKEIKQQTSEATSPDPSHQASSVQQYLVPKEPDSLVSTSETEPVKDPEGDLQ